MGNAAGRDGDAAVLGVFHQQDEQGNDQEDEAHQRPIGDLVSLAPGR